jgi:hypothetical protein
MHMGANFAEISKSAFKIPLIFFIFRTNEVSISGAKLFFTLLSLLFSIIWNF